MQLEEGFNLVAGLEASRDDVEDVVVDAFFFSQNCKRGKFPTLTCPECNGTMEHKGS